MGENVYKAPTKPNILGLCALFFSVFLIGVILAPIYLFAVWKSPYDILAGACAVVYGLIIAWAAYLIIKKMVLPNKIYNVVAFIFSYVLLTYVKWSFYSSYIEQYILYSQQAFSNYFNRFFDFFTSPVSIMAIIRYLYNNGVWTLSDSVVNGPYLAFFWLGEIILIAGCVIAIIIEKNDLPTVSNHQEWAQEHKDQLIAFKYFQLKDYETRLRSNSSFILDTQFERIYELNQEDHVNVRLFSAQDQSEHFITIQEKKYDRRNRQFNVKRQLKRLRIDRNMAQELLRGPSEGERRDHDE